MASSNDQSEPNKAATVPETNEQNGVDVEPLPPPTPVSMSEINVDFLPLIYDIVKCIEKESQLDSNSQKQMLLIRGGGDATSSSTTPNESFTKMVELNEKFTKFREQLALVPGIGTTKEEQLITLSTLREQLKMKKELLNKYRNLPAGITDLMNGIGNHKSEVVKDEN